MANSLTFIDLFAGAGGFSLGFHEAGMRGLLGIERDKMAFETLRFNLIENNHAFDWLSSIPVGNMDIRFLMEHYREGLISMRGKVDVVVGGPPCQGFSMAGRRIEHDERNQMFKEYLKFVDLVKPQMVLFENVPGFNMPFKANGISTHSYQELLGNQLQEAGFEMPESRIIDFSQYGVPQSRKRIIIFSTQKGNDPSLFFERLQSRISNHKVAVKDAISDLERSNGEVQSPDSSIFMNGLYGDPETPFQQKMRQGNIENIPDSHRFARHGHTVQERFKYILDSCPRGKNLGISSIEAIKSHKRNIIALNPSKPAPTLTSLPDDYIHYKEARILTVREYARLQSFPDWYEFKGKYTTGGKQRSKETPRYTQVANAVPPSFSKAAGKILQLM